MSDDDQMEMDGDMEGEEEGALEEGLAVTSIAPEGPFSSRDWKSQV